MPETTARDVWLAVYRDALARQAKSMMPNDCQHDEAVDFANRAATAFQERFSKAAVDRDLTNNHA